MSTREVSVPAAHEDDASGNVSPALAQPSPPLAAPAAPTIRPADMAKANGSASRVAPQTTVLHQVRGTVRHFDLWSVFRVSALIYGSFFLVALVAGVALWIVASATGARHSVEHFIASALLLKQFRFASLTIGLAATGIGLVVAAAATGATVAVAGFYNLVSEVVGGVELTIVQEETAGTVV
jgi:hypothetical protein